MSKRNIVAYMGLAACLVYFIVTTLFIVTGTSDSLIAMELATALSTPIMLMLFLVIPTGNTNNQKAVKRISIIFMSCCMALTSTVHFVYLMVIQPLINAGVQVPTYLQIGQWPSVIMGLEYIAWGYFLGVAFLCSSYAVAKDDKKVRAIKYTLFICGVLCLTGFLGVVLIGSNGWYIAPVGYGFGTAIICVQLLILNKSGRL